MSRGASYWIACHNFYVLTRYNRSRLYATAVYELATPVTARALALACGDDSARTCATSPRVDASVASGSAAFDVSAAAIGAVERLAELDAELVERVDAEEHRFDERAMLVERDQLAETMRVHLRHQDRRRRAIAGAHARRDGGVERGAGQSLGEEFRAQRVLAASFHQRLRLRERVCDEQRLLVGQRMRGTHGNDELDRRLARALMQPLEECVLAVGAGFAPERAVVGPASALPSRATRLPLLSRTSCCR